MTIPEGIMPCNDPRIDTTKQSETSFKSQQKREKKIKTKQSFQEVDLVTTWFLPSLFCAHYIIYEAPISDSGDVA